MQLKDDLMECNKLVAQGQIDEAEKHLHQILSNDSTRFNAWYFLGSIQMNKNKMDDAIDSYKKAIFLLNQEKNRFVMGKENQLLDIYIKLGVCYAQKQQLGLAIEWTQKALEIDPGNVDIWINLGGFQIHFGKMDEALSSINRGLKLNPQHPALLLNAAILMHQKKNYEEASHYYKKSLKQQKNIKAFELLIQVLIKLRRFQEGLDFSDEALKISPNNFDILQCRASIFMETAKYEEGINTYRKMLEVNPDRSITVSDLGGALTYAGHFQETISLYEEFMKKNPNDPVIDIIRWNMAFPLLLFGDFQQGLSMYESRVKVKQITEKYSKLTVITPRWQGEKIEGKTLLIRCSLQGLGDSIQFLRYLPKLFGYKCKIILEMSDQLHCIFHDLGITLVSLDDPTPDHDVHTDVMSLPYLFSTRYETIPPPISLKAKNKPIKNQIGIAWKGNPLNPIFKHKSMRVENFEKLLQIPGKIYLSLQKDVTDEEGKFLDSHHVQRPLLNTIEDVLEILQTCEMVITIDTMVAHLAATIGIPTWIFLPYVPDWRWFLERTDSPWYPTARLFRQKAMDDWSHPMDSVLSLFKKSISIQSH